MKDFFQFFNLRTLLPRLGLDDSTVFDGMDMGEPLFYICFLKYYSNPFYKVAEEDNGNPPLVFLIKGLSVLLSYVLFRVLRGLMGVAIILRLAKLE